MNISRAALQQFAIRYGIVGESSAMIEAISKVMQVAPTDLTVLLTGETGTGKEVFAHALHNLSQRKKHLFVSVNCGAIPETLLESELFGNEKGAFTGAVEQRKGFFETAHRGTIFLDEIGEMPVATQVKLLRVLESGEFSRLGSSAVLKVDVRVVTATNRDLLYEVRQGRFRQDLYFRLNSVNIHLPPLRKHPEDVEPLVRFFAAKVSSTNGFTFQDFSAEALEAFRSYPWPGNVRELRNVVETMVTLEHGKHVTEEMAKRYLPPVNTQEPVVPGAALMRIGLSEPTPTLTADVNMLYRTILQLSADINEMKSVLRHLVAVTINNPVEVRESQANEDQDPMNVSKISRVEESLPTLNIESLEMRSIREALDRTEGSRREAATLLGISERTLYRKLEQYNMTKYGKKEDG